MKKTNAVIGGEGNGGVIYPELHYGRDALVGIALFLTHLAERKISVKELRSTYPNYFILKNKIELKKKLDLSLIFSNLIKIYKDENINTADGLKIDFKDGWVHLRESNTEPIVRIYSESYTESKARFLLKKVVRKINKMKIL